VLLSYALAPIFLARPPSVDRRRVLVAVLPAAAALGAFTVATPVNLGLRYLLPVLALVTVCVAPIAHARRALPVLLVLGSAVFAIASLPHSTAWVSPLFAPG
jgi:L-cystine uptake protein TcyP (sodium:dicarboxylate symporter family)